MIWVYIIILIGIIYSASLVDQYNAKQNQNNVANTNNKIQFCPNCNEVRQSDICKCGYNYRLVKCPICMNYVADTAPQCLRCGNPMQPVVNPTFTPNFAPAQNNPNQIRCISCGSSNVQISMNTTSVTTQGKSDVRKRSMAERTANKAGRTMANAMTGGIYGFVAPKKGKYKEYSKSTTQTFTEKLAICQNCGKSWKVK